MILNNLFANNRKWAREIKDRDAEFFMKLSKQQAPEYLWIGCSDSRVPANEIVGLMPGELFVHRNIANLVVHTDLNCLSVIQYAIDILKVKHIIVCGHYGCGGIKAAIKDVEIGLAGNWIRHIQDIIERYNHKLKQLTDLDMKLNILCELNVIEQAYNIARTSIAKEAWNKQNFTIHGWIYGIEDGLLKNLEFSVSNTAQLEEARARAADNIFKRYNL